MAQAALALLRWREVARYGKRWVMRRRGDETALWHVHVAEKSYQANRADEATGYKCRTCGVKVPVQILARYKAEALLK